MKTTIAMLALTLLALAGCAGEHQADESDVAAASEVEIYELRGIILSRDAANNVIKVDHEEIPGYMAAMTMDYEVRGQEVTALPADGSAIMATVHATDDAYWLTDVNPVPDPTPPTTGTTDTAGTTTGPN
ncbi:MAG TPA: copper-binding protein [Thermoanaerobaculia bacterium]|nr:copper-binding protein [Thermoanaerobaculia bacterium]